MAIAQEPTKWNMPLGVNADVNDIPDTAPEYTGNASMNSVFPPITQVPLEAGGISPTRADFNGLFKLVGASIYYMQRGGIFSYADDVDYPAGAVVKFGNGIYIAIQANGPASTTVDPSDPNYWRHLTTTVNNQYADSNGNVNVITEYVKQDDKNGYIVYSNGFVIAWAYPGGAGDLIVVNKPKAFKTFTCITSDVTGSTAIYLHAWVDSLTTNTTDSIRKNDPKSENFLVLWLGEVL